MNTSTQNEDAGWTVVNNGESIKDAKELAVSRFKDMVQSQSFLLNEQLPRSTSSGGKKTDAKGNCEDNAKEKETGDENEMEENQDDGKEGEEEEEPEGDEIEDA